MSEPERETPVDPLFRAQAVEDYLRGRDHGRLLRVSPWWKHWAFGILVVMFAGAAVFAALAPLGIDLRAPAVVRTVPGAPQDLEVVCVLPPDALPSLSPGQRVVVDFGGLTRARIPTTLEAPNGRILGPDNARAWLGPEVGDIPTLAGATTFATARIPAAERGKVPGLAPGRIGTAYIRVGEQSLLRALTLAGAEP